MVHGALTPAVSGSSAYALELEGESWRTPRYFEGHVRELLAASAEQGLEGVVMKRLDSLYGGRKRLWITEYGYQTSPPDRAFGVRYAAQAKYVHQAFAVARKTRRIEMLVWFLIRDERRLSGWQSGVVSVRDTRKPSFHAFRTLRR